MDENASIANAIMICLAAGSGSRMGGRSKPDLPWVGGKTLLEHQLQTVGEAGFRALVVARAPRKGLWTVSNPDPESGLATSLQRGLSCVRRQVGEVAVGVMLADQPFVTPEDIRDVWARFCGRPGGIHAVRPRFAGAPGHPLFFDAEFDSVVRGLHGDRGIGAVWQGRTDVQWADISVGQRPSPAFDLDTDGAYQQALTWAR